LGDEALNAFIDALGIDMGLNHLSFDKSQYVLHIAPALHQDDDAEYGKASQCLLDQLDGQKGCPVVGDIGL
jgi:hypothetical protein